MTLAGVRRAAGGHRPGHDPHLSPGVREGAGGRRRARGADAAGVAGRSSCRPACPRRLAATGPGYRLLSHCTEKTNAPGSPKAWQQVVQRLRPGASSWSRPAAAACPAPTATRREPRDLEDHLRPVVAAGGRVTGQRRPPAGHRLLLPQPGWKRLSETAPAASGLQAPLAELKRQG